MAEPTPLPVKTLACLLFLQTMDSVAFTQVTPYLAYMTRDLMNLEDEREIGKYSGFIGAGSSIAQFFTAAYWGRMSDVNGRRPVLLVGLFGSIFATLMFGCSTSFLMAFTARILQGLMNGNLGIVKTCIAEVTDASNRAKAYSLIALAGGMGRIIGPMIGGFLYSPATQYPALFSQDGVFAAYPYLLPNAVSAVAIFLGWLYSFFFLPETRKVVPGAEKGANKDNGASSVGITSGLWPQWCCIGRSRRSPGYQKVAVVDGEDDSCDGLSQDLPESGKIRPPGAYSLVGVFMYGTMAISHALMMSVLPVWAVNRVSNGGVDFVPFDIGVVDLIAGGMLVTAQLFFNHKICNYVGVRRTYWIFLLVTVPVCLLVGSTPFLYSIGVQHGGVVLGVGTLYGLFSVLMNLSYISVYQIIQDTCLEDHLGHVNGIGQALVAAARGTSPIFGSIGLSWSLTNGHPFPLNHYFVFVLMGLFNLVPLVIFRHLPPPGTYQTVKPTKRTLEDGNEGAPTVEMALVATMDAATSVIVDDGNS
jgi:MFS family permease